jgi:hypothetical protein
MISEQLGLPASPALEDPALASVYNKFLRSLKWAGRDRLAITCDWEAFVVGSGAGLNAKDRAKVRRCPCETDSPGPKARSY